MSYSGDQIIIRLSLLPVQPLFSPVRGALRGRTACSLKAQPPGTFLLPQGTWLSRGSAHTTLPPHLEAFIVSP